jgi:anti-sigma B factor antagonist
MKIEVRKKGSVNILDMAGRMVIGDGDVQLRRIMRDLLAKGERFFVLNMKEVNWLDSGSVGEVVACRKRVADKDGSIKLVLQGGKAHDVFTTFSLDKVFEIAPDVETALALFADD